jgi:hypothetical protein
LTTCAKKWLLLHCYAQSISSFVASNPNRMKSFIINVSSEKEKELLNEIIKQHQLSSDIL